MTNRSNKKDTDSADVLGSADLAALIVDALLRANIVKEEDVERALKIATEEIEVLKIMADY